MSYCPFCGKKLIEIEETTFGGGPEDVLKCSECGKLMYFRDYGNGEWEMGNIET
ncbi:MAG: hypothetical protein ACTSV7_09080 [Candidatus Baldrarchaeia archaeon]